MKRILLIAAVVIVAALIVIQFFQPERNEAPATQASIFFQLDVPELVKISIVNSCYDCHSDQTRYPWYGKIAPGSWILNNHIVEGKEKLNFSRWSEYSRREQIKHLSEICEVVEEGSMPLKGYVFMHSDARLLPYQIENLCEWAEEASLKILSGE